MKAFYSVIGSAALILAAALPSGAQNKPFMEDLPYYVNNLEVFGTGQEPGRAFHIPGKNLSLNGTWKFGYYDCPSDVPSNFFSTSFNDRKWGTIEVPSNWEMQGYGQALFRNITTPFPRKMPSSMLDQYRKVINDPNSTDREKQMAQMRLQRAQGGDPFAVEVPYTPLDYNPTGAYRTSFTLPSSWKGDQIFLRFEKVASASFVWVNGQQVGYNEGAQEPSEYNITKFVKPGKNTVAVLVLKYSDGYYLESQDYWRLAGIFDDVTVYAAPQARIWDWQVITDFDSSYTDSQLSIAVDVRTWNASGDGYKVKATVSRKGSEVVTMTSSPLSMKTNATGTARLASTVKSPAKWSSETPELYDLNLTLLDPSGKEVDSINKRIGFKKTEIRNGVFYLNGVPLKVSAECSHMQHPEMGHAMTEEVVRQDIEILKKFNFNAVRTSHYPPVNEYLDLADEYGLFVIDETGDEAHATEYVCDMPEFTPMYRERVRQMVLRDRNHACVLFWSAGNESGEGNNITEVVKEGKSLDPTRFWMYGGNSAVHPAEDIVGPRYPAPLEHEIRYGIDQSDLRPSFMDEYLSVAGNGGGGMDDYWDEIYQHPKLMGGAIWDFVSVGITEPTRALVDKSGFDTPAHIMGRAKLVPGKTGKGIDLYRTDQWVQVYRADNVEISGNQLTLTLDIYPRLYNRSGGFLITKGSNQFGLKQQGADKLDFYIDTGSKQTLTASLPSDWENKWHNVTAVYDGSKMTVYIDGSEVASQPARGNIRNLPLSLCIGRNEEYGGQETDVYICDAVIDNVGVFAKAVEPGKVSADGSALWLDFEEEKNEGTFYSYGVGARTYGSIWPNRVPQPEMYQMKKSTQPLKFTFAGDGQVEVWNRNHFLNASFYKTTWSLMEDDKVIASGELNLDVAPLSRKVVSVPYTMPTIVPGKEYRLDISSVLRKDELWAPAGFEISWDQIEFPSWTVPERPEKVTGKVTLSQNSDLIKAEGNGFSYGFDPKTGHLVSMVSGGKEMLSSPMVLNLWRAPLANELDGWNSRSAGQASVTGYGSIGHSSVLASHYYAAGLDRLNTMTVSVSPRQAGDAVIIDVRELVTMGAAQTRQLDAYIMGTSYNGFESMYSYRIEGNGTMTVSHTLRPQGTMPSWLPRIGLTLDIDKSLSNVKWYGRGPQENYPDRKSGYRIGIYEDTVENMYEAYLIPQDNGLRTDNRFVTLTDASGKGFTVKMDVPFAFNASMYSTDNLTKAVYTYQLKKADDITLNLDYATSGVGCTARGIFDSYRAYPMGYQRTLTFKPVK